jgi:DNA-binding response OmpR family regulator
MTPLARVLVVDDEPRVASVLRDVLTERGYAVRTAGDGLDALSVLPVFQPDVMLLDLRMPGMSGLEVLAQVRADYPDLRVIIVTANSDEPTALRTLSCGAFDYVQKPFSLEAVERVVGAAVALPSGHD